MGLLYTTAAALALLATAAHAAPTELTERSSAAKVCDTATKICFTEYVSTNGVSVKVAIPDTATSGKPFDIMLSMTAPKAIGWAGVAWGGAMANNPLTLGWANGDKAVVSSRRTTGHTMPTVYDAAKYQLLSGVANATHWKLDVLCTGCSSWDAAGKTVNLDPAGEANLAFASSATAPSAPADVASRFGIHNTKGKWSHDLAGAKNADFDTLVKAAAAAKAARL